jgi:DNA-directed RNA polymerase specialized sigma24 family protein
MRIEEIIRAEHGRILTTPTNPVTWLVSTAPHKAIDRLRRRARTCCRAWVVSPTRLEPVSPRPAVRAH